MRRWEDNADDARRLDDGEGWAFAMLVACSVEKGNGDPKATRRERDAWNPRKTSARDFADRWGTDANRVLRYLSLWDRSASKAGQPTSRDLEPSDAWTLDLTGFPAWRANSMGLDSKTKAREPGAQKVADIKANSASVTKALADPAFARKVLADPAVLDAVEEAALEKHGLSAVEKSVGAAFAASPEGREQAKGIARNTKRREAEEEEAGVSSLEVTIQVLDGPAADLRDFAERCVDHGFADDEAAGAGRLLARHVRATAKMLDAAAEGATALTEDDLDLLRGGQV